MEQLHRTPDTEEDEEYDENYKDWTDEELSKLSVS